LWLSARQSSRRLPWNSFLDIGYVGNNTVNQVLEGDNDAINLANVNLVPAGALFNPNPITGAAADPLNANLADYAAFGTQCLSRDPAAGACTATAAGYGANRIGVVRHGGYSNYNAFQATWTRQKGAATFNLNYAFSKALGIRGSAQLGGTTSDSFNAMNNYGVLSHDRTHVFNASYQFDLGNRVRGNAVLKALANGWMIAGITTLQSGSDLQALYSPNFNLSATPLDPANPGLHLAEQGSQKLSQLALGTPNILVSPVYTCDPTKGLRQGQYINAGCITMPSYRWSNGQLHVANGPAMPSYYMRGPAFFNSDISAHKRFRIAEGQQIQFRFSAFNFLNHPLPSIDPNNTTSLDLHFTEVTPGKWVQTNQDFGTAPIKLGRRVLEFSVKYEF
jgi:hypothetical protein